MLVRRNCLTAKNRKRINLFVDRPGLGSSPIRLKVFSFSLNSFY